MIFSLLALIATRCVWADDIVAPSWENVDTTDTGERNWREDLLAQLARTQHADGSWANSNRQWIENDPNLCTAFALV